MLSACAHIKPNTTCRCLIVQHGCVQKPAKNCAWCERQQQPNKLCNKTKFSRNSGKHAGLLNGGGGVDIKCAKFIFPCWPQCYQNTRRPSVCLYIICCMDMEILSCFGRNIMQHTPRGMQSYLNDTIDECGLHTQIILPTGVCKSIIKKCHSAFGWGHCETKNTWNSKFKVKSMRKVMQSRPYIASLLLYSTSSVLTAKSWPENVLLTVPDFTSKALALLSPAHV